MLRVFISTEDDKRVFVGHNPTNCFFIPPGPHSRYLFNSFWKRRPG